MPDLPYRKPHHTQFKVNTFTPPMPAGNQQIKTSIRPGTGIIIVIPCFNEPDVITTLTSLWNCIRPQCKTEVIIVINAPENSPDEILIQNEKTHHSAVDWIRIHTDDKLQFHLIRYEELPGKHAGVGLARKIGMDEAFLRFQTTGNNKGIIVCFDSDCLCDRNYLAAIENHFSKNPKSPACSIYFEHPLLGREHHSDVYEGILRYELFLRYYRQGLKFAGLPYAFHTIGSCMAVREDIYKKAGGMNKRKAGEDFYFLQKIIPLGNFTEINTTRVIPSPRPSGRVPFGTGMAIEKWLSGNKKSYPVYHPEIFYDLKQLCKAVKGVTAAGMQKEYFKSFCYSGIISSMPPPLATFLTTNGFKKNLEEIKDNSASPESFAKRFFKWFNAFMALKYAHFSRDNYYGLTDIGIAATELFQRMDIKKTHSDLHELLMIYRQMDKTG